MERNLSKDEIRLKVENQRFLKEIFDYDERGFLVSKRTRKIAGSIDKRNRTRKTLIHDCQFILRRLIWIFHNGVIDENFATSSVNGDMVDDRIENICLIPRKHSVAKDRSIESDVNLLRSIFNYDSEIGKLSWKVALSKRVQASDSIQNNRVCINRTHFSVQRICFVIFHGKPIPHGMVVDHINGNHLDNRITNLRVVTLSENAMNTRRKDTKPDGLPKGVHFSANSRKKFRSSIKLKGKTKQLGYFFSAEEAGKAYEEAAKKLFGEFACVNR